MARKKKKSARRKTKTISVGQTVGWGVYGMKVIEQFRTYTGRTAVDYAITNATGLRYGQTNPNGNGFAFDQKVFIDTWKEPVAGMLVSKIMPKIPIVRTLPKSIPVVGKYLRW